MKTTMKQISALAIVTLLAVSFNAFSQNTKNVQVQTDDGKMHIKVEIEKDGKVTKIDTTIDTEALEALNERLSDMDIHIGELDDIPGQVHAQAFSFGWDPEELEAHMKVLNEHMLDTELFKIKDGEMVNMEEFEKQMEELGEKMKNNCFIYKYKMDGDSSTKKELMDLEKELEHLNELNFNFNDDGDGKTIIIKSNDKDNADGPEEKKVIMKRKMKTDKKDSKQKNDNKRVIIIMKSAGMPEKQKAEYAAEPMNERENNAAANKALTPSQNNGTDANASWLNNLACYPNPSTGEFTLSFRLSDPQPAEVKIMDVAGREVFAENFPENTGQVEKQITLPVKSSAAYLLILRQGNNWHHEKIFVKS